MTKDQFERYTIGELRSLLARLGGAPGNKKKADLIDEIISIRDGTMTAVRSKRGRPSSRAKRSGIDFLDENDLKVTSLNHVACDRLSLKVDGILEKGENGGYLRGADYSVSKNNAFLSKEFIKKNNLLFGDRIVGESVEDNSAKPAVLRTVLSVNGGEPRKNPPADFDSLEISFPSEKIELSNNDSVCLKIIDTVCPIVKGQRGVVSLSKNSTKVSFLKDLASSLSKKQEMKSIFALVDERPEDLSFIKSECGDIELACSIFDKKPSEHIRVVESAVNRAKSLALGGEDVVIVIDSLQKLAKAYYSQELILEGDKSTNLQTALLKIKKLLACARKLNEGSITAFAVSEFSDNENEARAIHEEIKCISNFVIKFDAELLKKRVFPSLDLSECYSEFCEEIFSDEELATYDLINKILLNERDGSEKIIKVFQKHAFDGRAEERLKEIYLLQK